jgi:HEAT repeat protein
MSCHSPAIDEALAALSSDDRNVRARAIKILAQHSGRLAAEGMLKGLNDPKRRVRENAAKLCGAFARHPEIAVKLQQMVNDSAEKLKIRRYALAALLGGHVDRASAPELNIAKESIEQLLQSEAHRQAILLGLLQLELSDKVVTLLKTFVKDGSKEEAVAATRALCGFKVMNLGSIKDPTERRLVASTCDLAFGQVYYWVTRAR